MDLGLPMRPGWNCSRGCHGQADCKRGQAQAKRAMVGNRMKARAMDHGCDRPPGQSPRRGSNKALTLTGG